MESSNKYWYALYTKPKQEFKAAKEFFSVQLEYYLPSITRTKQWSDRKKKVTEPLFKGYIFVHGNEKERLLALQQSAVVRSVTFNGVPAYVQNWEIENLRRMLEKNPEIKIEDELKAGTKVKVIEGLFDGLEGIVYHTPNNERELAIVIDLLKRSVVVNLPPECIVKKIE